LTRINEELEEEMIGLVAARHGIALDREDPAAIIPTLVQLGIERALHQVGSDHAARREEIRNAMAETQAAAVAAMEKELAAIVAGFREQMRRDFDGASASAATLVANIGHAQSRSLRLYWLTLGLTAAIVLIGIGFAAGLYLGPH